MARRRGCGRWWVGGDAVQFVRTLYPTYRLYAYPLGHPGSDATQLPSIVQQASLGAQNHAHYRCALPPPCTFCVCFCFTFYLVSHLCACQPVLSSSWALSLFSLADPRKRVLFRALGCLNVCPGKRAGGEGAKGKGSCAVCASLSPPIFTCTP